MRRYAMAVRAPEFPENLSWIGGADTMAGLRGRVVILHFWTAG